MPVTSAIPSPTNAVRQLSDQNTQGTQLGASATDLVGFYGQAPIAQPPSQGSVGGLNGLVSVAAVTVTATSVAPNTTAEQTFTVTGAVTGGAVVLQKPTVNAGVGVVGMRVSATNTVGITYANDTAATITPTAGETYTFELFPAAMTISATLTPSAVAPNNFAEQQFSVGGLAAGAALIVNKPTAQAGLGIVDARMVSAGVVGITFGNFTAATITPTAGESYKFVAVPSIQTAPIFQSFTALLTPVSVAANTTAEQTFTIVGLPASSQVLVNKPTVTAGLGLGGARVSALNTLAICYVNNTASAITPPAETYTIGLFAAAAPAAGSTTTTAARAGAADTGDHNALVSLGLIAGP